MTDLKEALITKKNIKNTINAGKWPNPFNIKEGDLKGKIANMPIEIVTLILAYEKFFNGNYNLNLLTVFGLDCAFEWCRSSEGARFWREINDGNYDVFYKKYNPKTLEKKLEEMDVE